MNKEVLQKELDLIQSPVIREWTKDTLANAPDYFFIAQASSTGKYHPRKISTFWSFTSTARCRKRSAAQ